MVGRLAETDLTICGSTYFKNKFRLLILVLYVCLPILTHQER